MKHQPERRSTLRHANAEVFPETQAESKFCPRCGVFLIAGPAHPCSGTDQPQADFDLSSEPAANSSSFAPFTIPTTIPLGVSQPSARATVSTSAPLPVSPRVVVAKKPQDAKLTQRQREQRWEEMEQRRRVEQREQQQLRAQRRLQWHQEFQRTKKARGYARFMQRLAIGLGLGLAGWLFAMAAMATNTVQL